MKKLFITLGVWVLVLYGISFFADYFLLYAPSFPYADVLLPETGLPRFVYSWANFDGVHYLTIVKNGYVGTGLIQAFFPVYPALIALDQVLGIDPIISGQILSLASFLGVLIVWGKLVTAVYGKSISHFSRYALLVFPTAFFFMAVYTESLFLVLVLLSFYAANQKKWWLAIAAAAVASGTRIVGIALLPALLVEYLDQRSLLTKELLTKPIALLGKLDFTDFTRLISIFLSTIGLLGYSFFLYKEFKDPLYFFHVQEEFGGGRSESLVLFPQVVVRYTKILLTVPVSTWSFFTYLQEFAISMGGLTLLVFGWMRRLRWSHLIYGTIVFLIPTLTGTFSSMPRYVLACFPVFIVWAMIVQYYPKLRFVWYVISSILLVLSTLLFIQGYWLA